MLTEKRLRSRSGKNVLAKEAALTTPPTLPRPPVVGGKLAGREFLEYEDGSIEIDTLVGRRRFVSIDAAEEFVGA